MKIILIILLTLGTLSCFADSKWPSSEEILATVFSECGLEIELSPICKRDRKNSKVLYRGELLISFICSEEISGATVGSYIYDFNMKQVVKDSIFCE